MEERRGKGYVFVFRVRVSKGVVQSEVRSD